MQEELRYLAHRALCAQETQRGEISRELHDEIAQSIFGIHIRLLTLKQKSTADLKEVLREISTTERLVERSVWKMRQFVRTR